MGFLRLGLRESREFAGCINTMESARNAEFKYVENRRKSAAKAYFGVFCFKTNNCFVSRISLFGK